MEVYVYLIKLLSYFLLYYFFLFFMFQGEKREREGEDVYISIKYIYY